MAPISRSPAFFYALLLLWVCLGWIVDAFLGPRTPQSHGLNVANDLVQAFGIAILTLLCCRADARSRQQPVPSSALSLAILLLPPLGTGIYAGKTRPVLRAIALFLGFWVGVFLAMTVGDTLAPHVVALIQ